MTTQVGPSMSVRGPGFRRHRFLIAVVVTTALFATAGLIASTRVKSPAQLAAEHGPPAPSALTAAVTEQVLRKSVVLRGTVAAESSLTVTPTAAQGASALVVTRTPARQGAAVAAGKVLVEVSGRPLIALPGAVPAYRDLRPGDRGGDVAQLQKALRSLGYADRDPRGEFGPGTKRAVTRLYQKLGYNVPTTGGAETTPRTAERAVTQARRAVSSAEEAAAQAESGLTAARAATPADPGAVARAKQESDRAKETLTYAREDFAAAKQDQARLVATTGAMMPLNEFVFVPRFPARLERLRGGVGAPVTAPLVTLNTGKLAVRGILPPTEKSLVKPGMAVRLDAEQLNQRGTGSVTAIGAYEAGGTAGPGQDPAAARPAGHPLTVTPKPALPEGWLGQDVRISVDAASTGGPVLVVPVAAVSAGQDGGTAVTVLDASGGRTRVPVAAGLDANGLVEVRPAAGARLRAGDEVVIG
ncbi:peptidoglycan-binding protein [Actinoplanes sp. NPDC048988]|uniref:peptidoglycan-binding domain-containing protein n=1 Tax=Actinoplanes sp. NPDC048988 TaxID=3363901 RepID=UPI003710BE5D